MRYTSIELAGYKRFSLNEINYFKATFTADIQLIIGSNGSGKSSLVRELTFLPATAGDYTKDGYRIVEGVHRGTHYRASSVFSRTKIHSFEVDGVEMNLGGTAQIQREVVRQHLQMTPELHDLLLGVVTFHSMGPAERRHWLTQLSSVDYRYAIGVYQRLKEKHRDLAGAIKVNTARLVQETQRVLTPEAEAVCRAAVAQLQSDIERLLELKPVVTESVTVLDQRLAAVNARLNDTAEATLTLWRALENPHSAASIEAIDRALVAAEIEEAHVQQTLNTLAARVTDNEQMLALLAKTQLDSLQELDARCAEAEAAVAAQRAQVRLPVVYADPVQALHAFEAVRDALVAAVSELLPNPNRQLCSDRLRSVLDALHATTQQLEYAQRTAQTCRHDVQALDDDRDRHGLECPACHHRWHQLYNAKKHADATAALTAAVQQVAALEAQQAAYQAEEETLRTYLTHYKAYIVLRRNWPVLNPLWEGLEATDWLFQQPNEAVCWIEQAGLDLTVWVAHADAVARLNALQLVKAQLLNQDHAGVENCQQQLEAAHADSYAATCRLTTLAETMTQLRATRAAAITLATYSTALNTLLQDHAAAQQAVLDALQKQAVNEMLRTAQLALARNETQLNEIDAQSRLVASLQQQVADHQQQQQIYAALIAALSPVDGLIAEGLFQFIHALVAQMNQFIAKIWLYPLQILPCGQNDSDSLELDYKFPLQVGDGTPVADVSRGSSAMQELVDLAFKVVCMHYLQVGDGVLVLDEFAAKMDDAHRTSAFHVISQLTAERDFSQLFIISHYHSVYGCLKNAEITVLCERNVTLPKNAVFNQHVIMR